MNRRSDVLNLVATACRGIEKRHGIELGLVTILLDNRPEDQWEKLPIFARHPNGNQVAVWNEAEDKTGEWKDRLWPRLMSLD